MIARASSVLDSPSSTDEHVLDPRKSLPDYRREIYDLLQYLDEEQDKIERQLARFSSVPSSAHKQTSRRPSFSQASKRDDDGACSESEDEDDFVVVEDVNAASRKKQLLNQLQQLWRTRDALRKRARQLNIRIDSLTHGKGSGLMPVEDLLQSGVDFHGQDDGDEL
ncbi:uncharacterized protein UTRI_02145_B [Ustilago trichophora]|uniref:Uncharacterized protein n=1 Tax=Ustilago trichophora TaxID=86804 RepID=A0A5C3DYG5_9BASI|nr:uncharacterized protein UTRI_02145_B [Ustilago trichophora]